MEFKKEETNQVTREDVLERKDKKTNLFFVGGHDALKWAILGLLVFLAAAVIFAAGVFVGSSKARFSYKWAENYHTNFGGPEKGFMIGIKTPLAPDEFIKGHGTFGEIIKTEENGFTIKGENDMEKFVLVDESTIIQRGPESLKKSELKAGQKVVVIGSPNDQGQIVAKLVRMFGGEGAFMPPKNIFFKRI